MSVDKFLNVLHQVKLGKNDRVWFPRWLRRYASSIGTVRGDLSVTEEQVIGFLRSLRDHGTPAWQRLQAVRAVELYRNEVLRTADPCLQTIRQKLSQLADQEKASGQGEGPPGSRDERHLIGRIDPREPGIIQQMRRELRVRQKALETERAYVGWVQRFIRWARQPETDWREWRSRAAHRFRAPPVGRRRTG